MSSISLPTPGTELKLAQIEALALYDQLLSKAELDGPGLDSILSELPEDASVTVALEDMNVSGQQRVVFASGTFETALLVG